MKCVFTIAALSALAAAQSSTSSDRESSTSTSRVSNESNLPFPTPSGFTKWYNNPDAATKDLEKLISDLSAFETSLTAKPEYTAFQSALSNALPSSEAAALTDTDLDMNLVSQIAGATGTPTWWTQIPTSDQAYYTSVLGAIENIATSDVKGPAAPTAAPMMRAAGVAAAGALAGAALLL